MKPIKGFREKLNCTNITVGGRSFSLSADNNRLWIENAFAKNMLCIEFHWNSMEKRLLWSKTEEPDNVLNIDKYEYFNPIFFKTHDGFINWLSERILHVWWDDFEIEQWPWVPGTT